MGRGCIHQEYPNYPLGPYSEVMGLALVHIVLKSGPKTNTLFFKNMITTGEDGEEMTTLIRLS